MSLSFCGNLGSQSRTRSGPAGVLYDRKQGEAGGSHPHRRRKRLLGRHWMMFLGDVDRPDKKTGWERYDFAVNRIAPGENEAFFELNAGDWKWQIAGKIPFRVNGRRMELAIPRAFFGEGSEPLNFEFKWIDNLRKEGNVMDFYHSDDAAPGERFNYSFSEDETP